MSGSPCVLIVSQAFKQSFSAAEVARQMAAGARDAGFSTRVCLASDGGDGLLEALREQFTQTSRVTGSDPLGRSVGAEVGWLDQTTAVVESRHFVGLSLLRADERDPLVTSTRGLGEALMAVGELGARRVFVGLGGSATMDGGVGMARAWGWLPRDATGGALPEGGGALVNLASVDPGSAPAVELWGICDVRNPLLGPEGARRYAGQKGATISDEAVLSDGLHRLTTARGLPCGPELGAQPMTGAAGGLGFGLCCFGGAVLVPGADWVLERVGFSECLREVQLLVTGEGRYDATSREGKLTGELIERARQAGVPTVLLAPEAIDAPDDVVVEAGGGRWSAADLRLRARAGILRAARLLAP